jgi:ribosomal protein S18 acetylase RimI-like enzyme
MKRKDNIYSAIDDQSVNEASFDKKKLIVWYYDNMLAPVALFGVILAVFTFFSGEYFRFLESIEKNNFTDNLFLFLLILFSLFVGIRIYQSLLLAKKDYSSIKNCFLDILTFLVVALFISGVIIAKYSNNIKQLYIAYSALSTIGTINFLDLYFRRLEKNEKTIDKVIEKRIQLFNSAVFFITTIILSIISLMLLYDNYNMIFILIGGAVICLLMVLNIMHSGQLTAMPKILLQNKADSPENIAEHLREFLGKVLKEDNKDKIIQISNNDIRNTYKYVTISRMNKENVEAVAKDLLFEFGYVFEYIFITKDTDVLNRAVRSLLTSAWGFGELGYVNFYSIKNGEEKNEKEIGWMKIHSNHHCWIYKVLENLSLFFVAFQFRIRDWPEIYRRAKKMNSSQPSTKKEKNVFELTYFFIHEQHRRCQYGTYTINLIVNALFHSKTNNINADKLKLLIRESNIASKRLFENIGFEVYIPEKPIEEPPEIIKAKGEGILYQYPKSNN